MNEAIEQIQSLTPLGALVVLAGVAASILTQVLKQPGMTKQRRQLVAVASSVVLGILAYVVVLGTTAGIPQPAIEMIGTGVVVVAGVAIMSRAAYALLGRVVPDGGTSDAPEDDEAAPEALPVPTADADGEAPVDADDKPAEHGRRALR